MTLSTSQQMFENYKNPNKISNDREICYENGILSISQNHIHTNWVMWNAFNLFESNRIEYACENRTTTAIQDNRMNKIELNAKYTKYRTHSLWNFFSFFGCINKLKRKQCHREIGFDILIEEIWKKKVLFRERFSNDRKEWRYNQRQHSS